MLLCLVAWSGSVGLEEHQLVHLLCGHLLLPLQCQALLAHADALAAHPHGGHRQQPQCQTCQPGELVHGGAPVLEQVWRGVEQRFCQVLEQLLLDPCLLRPVCPCPVHSQAATLRHRRPVAVPVLSARTSSSSSSSSFFLSPPSPALGGEFQSQLLLLELLEALHDRPLVHAGLQAAGHQPHTHQLLLHPPHQLRRAHGSRGGQGEHELARRRDMCFHAHRPHQ